MFLLYFVFDTFVLFIKELQNDTVTANLLELTVVPAVAPLPGTVPRAAAGQLGVICALGPMQGPCTQKAPKRKGPVELAGDRKPMGDKRGVCAPPEGQGLQIRVGFLAGADLVPPPSGSRAQLS